MTAGTLAGLIAKYVLDKRYIFRYAASHLREDALKFFAYSMTGVLTTILFWGTEIFFASFFNHSQAKYAGACLGLTVGYVMKYFLDKHLVFGRQS